YLDLNDLNMSSLMDYSHRIAQFTVLEKKMNQIVMELGESPEDVCYIPQLELNKKLEIIDYHFSEECQPELARRIMAKIKELPEWRRLVKK
ncbi:hypothetical protein ACFL5L_06570, partial [candidate division KSB1 bacterium]